MWRVYSLLTILKSLQLNTDWVKTVKLAKLDRTVKILAQ